LQSQSDGALLWKITNGNVDKGMPPFSGLPEMQRWQIILYVRTLKQHGEIKTPSGSPDGASETQRN